MSRIGAVLLLMGALQSGSLMAQAPGAAPRVQLSLDRDSLRLTPNLTLRAGGRLGPRTTPTLFADRWASETMAAIRESREARRGMPVATPSAVAVIDSVPETEEEAGIPVPELGPEVPGLPTEEGPLALGGFADLGLQLNAHFELKLDRLQNERCTSADVANPLSGCQGGFPTPDFDQQFQVRASGVVGERVNVNVDFDSEREFSANNDLRVWYEGLEDEILRRVEVGNVDFSAPSSRFITAAIPANSFGIQAEAQLGAFDFRSIFAQQKGSALRSRTFSIGETTTQPVDREIRDLEFEAGRFFSVISPLDIPGFPGLDILNLDRSTLPLELQPVEVRIYRLRAQGGLSGSNVNLGGINAIAIRDDSPQRVGPFPWEILVQGRDYYIDPSGLWFALASRVGTNDFLAVSFITASGDTVGTFPAVDGELDTLELIYEPNRGFEVPTSIYELRNVYRIGGGNIERSTLSATLVVNESEQPLGGNGTYLSLLGMARVTDESSLDQINRVFPRARDPNQGAPLRDLYLVFPHLQPFADSLRLQAGERNDSLYRTPTYLRNTQGPPPTFRIRMHYEATSRGDRSQLSLGALQLREGSEKLFVGGRELVRGVDYDISYEVGEVVFLSPDELFTGPTQVTVQFEENQLFDFAPKSILGLSTTYNLGSRGRIDALALFQRESSSFNRPQLGFEPQATLIGGLSADLRFQPNGLTDLLNSLPLIETSVPSNLTINGEVAFSKPNPNRAGQAFIEEFEGSGGGTRIIPLFETSFQLGGAPTSGRGLPVTHLGGSGGFELSDAVPLVWQNLVQIGDRALQFEPQQIDSTINLVGTTRQTETVLWMTLKPDTIGGAPDSATGEPRWFRSHTAGPRWRSITQSLDPSGLGVDLSRVEFLEFWVLEDAARSAKQNRAVILLDFGTVFEDAVAPAPTNFEVVSGDTLFGGLQFVGIGTLNTERDTLTNVFNAVVDDRGILSDRVPLLLDVGTGTGVEDVSLCAPATLGGLPVFPLGDLGARCTRGNGRLDTEDLNGDNRLDVTVGAVKEDVFRYVFPVGDDRFFVRTGGSLQAAEGGSLVWRLYRIPFRSDTLQIGTPNVRQIRALRMTMVVPDQGPVEQELFLALARMRLVGAPWLKRASTPIAGIAGKVGEPHGEVIASVVTTENQDLGYTPPPGVFQQSERRGSTFQLVSEQINERSLRLLASDLRSGERAEAFVRFSDEADKNFLKYRKLRVWARGRGPGWEDGDLQFFIKVGRDEDNFYFYRTPARTVSWEPEVVIDLAVWTRLRAEVESAWLRGEQPSGAAECGGDPLAFVACEGPYLVHVKDPRIAPPNLARVSEVAVGMERVQQTVFSEPAELWVDDIRLSDVVDDVGVAGAVDIRLNAADVADIDFSFSATDDQFRQLSEQPSYVTDILTRYGLNLRLDKLLPQDWGVSLPINVQRIDSRSEPFFLARTDVRADAIPNLRESDATSNSYSIAFRRTKRGQSFLERLLVDPVTVRANVTNADFATELSTSETRNRQVVGTYNQMPDEKTVRAAPGFLIWLVNRMPGFIKNSAFGEALRSSRLRWNPFQVRWSTSLTNSRTTRFTFGVPVELPSDSALRPLRGINHTWRNDFTVDLRPFRTLILRVDYSSTRDLQDYGDSTTTGRLLSLERKKLLGSGVGFERLRSLNTSLNLNPVVSSWFRPRITLSSFFNFNRDPNRGDPFRVESQSSGAFKLPETLFNSRRRELGTTVELSRLVSGVAGETSIFSRLFRRVLPADVSHILDRRSSFDRARFDPGLRFQLGLGSFDEFLEQEGQPATSAAETKTLTVTGGTGLPLGLRVRLNFRDTDASSFAFRSGVQTEVVSTGREWPSGVVSWSYTPTWSLRKVISSIQAQTQYRVNRQTTRVPQVFQVDEAGREAVTENRSKTLAPSVTLSWAGGVTTALQYSQSESDQTTSGNITRTDQKDWNLNVNFSFRPPRSIARLTQDVLTTLSGTVSDVVVCLERTGSDECITVSDSRRRQINFRMSTRFSQSLDGGTSFSYVLTEQRHTSTKFSQIIFTIFARLNFLSGRLR